MTAEPLDATRWGGASPQDAGAGEHHSLVLCSSGQVYTFGRADSGQLGVALGDGQRACPVPIPVTSMPEPAVLIAAGGNHNLAVGASGRLYSWGYGEMHQLGHGPDEVEQYPRAVDYAFSGRIVQVAAGGQHSVVLCHEG